MYYMGVVTTLYIGSEDKNVYALNTADGTKKWSYATGAAVSFSSPTLCDGKCGVQFSHTLLGWNDPLHRIG